MGKRKKKMHHYIWTSQSLMKTFNLLLDIRKVGLSLVLPGRRQN